MIPVRIMVRGFLSYRERAELTFDGDKLWMLAGRNGAGKSAIFDAMTFALFKDGRFEGTVQDYINHDSPGMEVEFDFDLDKKRYRVKRSVTKGGGSTYQAYTLDQANKAVPIAGTDRDGSLGAWVSQTLNMNKDAFAASAMLRQGNSDSLILSTNAPRAEIMGRIIDLNSYAKLYGVVNSQAGSLREEATRLQKEVERIKALIRTKAAGAIALFALPDADYNLQEVWQDSVNRLTAQLTTLEGEAKAEAERLQLLLDTLNRIDVTLDGWRNRQSERAALRLKKVQYAAILARLSEIERNFTRFTELTQTIPLRQEWNKTRLEWQTAKGKRDDAVVDIEKFNTNLTELNAQVPTAAQALTEAKARLKTAAQTLSDCKAELSILEKRKGDLLKEKGEAACTTCGKLLTEEQRQKQLALVTGAIAEAKEQAEEAARQTREATRITDAAEKEVNRLKDEIAAMRGKITVAEGKCNLAAQAMQTAETNAERTLSDLKTSFENCSVLAVNGIAYALEDIGGLILNGEASADALETGTYPTPEDIETATKERQSLQRAAIEKRELEAARLEAGSLDAQIETYATQIQADETQVATEITAFEEAVRRELIELTETLDTAKSEIDGLTEIDPDFLKKVKTAADRPVLWTRNKKADCAQAKTKAQEREKEAHENREGLERDSANHAETKEKTDAATRQAKVYRTLADKLHNKGLQSWLRVAAERSIVANADVILQRLSDNMLTVKLAEGDGGIALDLRVTDFEKGARDLRPQALSGSQKFRLSVALALGIGQYACNQTQGGIKSVIIDEGFGGLDKEGREQMIAELRNLSKFLERIIVVSHQEEFQEAADFSRWNIFVANGTAQAERAA